jgi:hypothetical protein
VVKFATTSKLWFDGYKGLADDVIELFIWMADGHFWSRVMCGLTGRMSETADGEAMLRRAKSVGKPCVGTPR